jgi:hypothetical protein
MDVPKRLNSIVPATTTARDAGGNSTLLIGGALEF